MEKENRNLCLATKDYTPFPIEACGLFKTKDLYLLAGMYLSSHYQENSNVFYTNITISQLSALTKVKENYIKEYFYPKLKGSGYVVYECTQEQFNVKRNHFYLPKPTQNFRFIRKELFCDSTLTPEEKGIIISLYCLCVNNTFRFNLTDRVIWEKLGVTKNTFKKYRNSLIEKNVLWSSYDVPLVLTSIDHLEAKIILYPHLGYTTWIDLVEEYKPTEEEIEDYLLMTEDIA